MGVWILHLLKSEVTKYEVRFATLLYLPEDRSESCIFGVLIVAERVMQSSLICRTW